MIKLTGAISVLAVVGVLLFAVSPEHRISAEILDLYSLEQRFHRTMSGPKPLAYKEVFLDADKHLPVPLLGGGPGNYTSILAFDNLRPRAFLPHMLIHYSDVYRKLTYSGSVLSSPRSGFITIYGELGPMGFFLFWGGYLYVVWVIFRQLIEGKYIDTSREIMAAAFIPSMLVLVLLNILLDSVRGLHLNLGMWIWAAMVWRPCKPAEVNEAVPDSKPDLLPLQAGVSAAPMAPHQRFDV
jgi:hypothetical protein